MRTRFYFAYFQHADAILVFVNTLNEILRRGGTYRNGACVLALDLDHPDIVEFITTPRSELPWVKRCVCINDEKWKNADPTTREALIYGIRSGDIWLSKIKYDKNGKRKSKNYKRIT